METIVCKFGGTSVADADAIKRVESIAEADESRRFIVVSAPGKRFAGDTKVTDLFYTAVKAANENGRAEFEKVFSVIFARFRAIVAALFPYSSFPGKILAELNAIGRRVYEEKDEDFAASRGEYLTGKILAEFLGCAFIDAEELILFTDGGAIDDRTYEIARSRLKGEMRAVIPGFLRQKRRWKSENVSSRRRRHHGCGDRLGGTRRAVRKLDGRKRLLCVRSADRSFSEKDRSPFLCGNANAFFVRGWRTARRRRVSAPQGKYSRTY